MGYGPTIFLWADDNAWVGFWDRDFDKFYFEGRDKHDPQPTLWMPIPKPSAT